MSFVSKFFVSWEIFGSFAGNNLTCMLSSFGFCIVVVLLMVEVVMENC